MHTLNTGNSNIYAVKISESGNKCEKKTTQFANAVLSSLQVM